MAKLVNTFPKALVALIIKLVAIYMYTLLIRYFMHPLVTDPPYFKGRRPKSR